MIERKTKTFPVGAVLSVVSGHLVSENHMTGIYQVLSWMAGEDVYTHQVPRVMTEAAPVILQMHPHLADAIEETKKVNAENLKGWLDTWRNRYGDEIAVPLLNIDEHERIDPMSELSEKVHPSKIVTI